MIYYPKLNKWHLFQKCKISGNVILIDLTIVFVPSDTQHLLQLYRYIELNLVRAGMVEELADYSWSSYQFNGLGKKTALLTPHRLYLAIVQEEQDRLPVIGSYLNITSTENYLKT